MSKKSQIEEWLEFLSSLSDKEYAEYVDLGHPEIPSHDCMPFTTDYSSRGPNDFVLSGPLRDAVGRGRRFDTISDALRWAQEKYGASNVDLLRRIKDVPEELLTRWYLLVRNVKS